ncbi:MAG: phosphatase PAP2 family protein, partial [Hyphomicrobiales bacterium]|nr:phosphatase PAP2 family protein [Hyphomicrobiales bacterium]
LGVLAFVYIGHEVGEEELVQFDSSILLAFRDPADLSRTVGPPWLAESVVEITALGGYTLIVVLVAAVIGLLLINGLRGPALFVLLSVATGWVTSQLLKSFYDRPRPDLVPQLDIVHTASFPSGHAMMTTLVYLTLASVIARLTEKTSVRIYVFAVAVAIALAVGLTRIFLGVHWPSDVIAGWALGAAWAALSWLAVSVLRRRRDRERGRLQSE